MLLLIPAAVALGVALLRGGSLHALATAPLRGVAWIALAIGLQVLLYLPGVRGSALIAHMGPALYTASMVCALCAVLCNRRLGLGAWLITAGVALNTLVILANGGSMPVAVAALRQAEGAAGVRDLTRTALFHNTRLADPASRLAPLSDVIPVNVPGLPSNVYSLGDLLIAAGGAVVVYRLTRREAAQVALAAG